MNSYFKNKLYYLLNHKILNRIWMFRILELSIVKATFKWDDWGFKWSQWSKSLLKIFNLERLHMSLIAKHMQGFWWNRRPKLLFNINIEYTEYDGWLLTMKLQRDRAKLNHVLTRICSMNIFRLRSILSPCLLRNCFLFQRLW